MAGGRNSAKKLKTVDRQSRAVELRKNGLTFRAIGEAIAEEYNLPNYNQSRAFEDVDKAMKYSLKEMALSCAEQRELENQRYDDLLLGLWPRVQQGEVKAIAEATKIIQGRCKMLGLDAPIEIKVGQAVADHLESFLESIRPHLPSEIYTQVLDAIAASQSVVTGS